MPVLRVAVDATSLLDRPTGVGVFTRALLGGLADRDDLEVRAFAVTWRGRNGLAGVVPAGVAAVGRRVPARLARAAWACSDQVSARHLAGTVDVVHGPNFVVPPGGGAATVVTVHDLTAVRFPELCTPDVLAWPGLLRRSLARGAWVHAVSRAVADEVRDAFPEAGERVVAVPNGVDPPAPPTDRTDAARGRHLAGSRRYVLAVGTVEPRKDLPSLVRAFDLVADHDAEVHLVLAGADGWSAERLTEAVDAARHRRRIVRLGWVDDDTRLALLRGAAVLAYPSRYEGFGLPPLEAMGVDLPVVATGVGAVAEVVGDAALLVPVGDAEALATALTTVLDDEDLRATLVAAGRERVAGFTWHRTVTGIADLYHRARA